MDFPSFGDATTYDELFKAATESDVMKKYHQLGTAINVIPTGSNTMGLAAGDFNRDGRLDLAAANFASNSVSLLLNRGGGLLYNDQDKDLLTGSVPVGIACADVNEDGIPDLVVASYGSDFVSVFLGKGDGSFNPRRDFATAGHPLGIAVSDFNGDGHLDAIASSGSASAITLFTNNGGP